MNKLKLSSIIGLPISGAILIAGAPVLGVGANKTYTFEVTNWSNQYATTLLESDSSALPTNINISKSTKKLWKRFYTWFTQNRGRFDSPQNNHKVLYSQGVGITNYGTLSFNMCGSPWFTVTRDELINIANDGINNNTLVGFAKSGQDLKNKYSSYNNFLSNVKQTYEKFKNDPNNTNFPTCMDLNSLKGTYDSANNSNTMFIVGTALTAIGGISTLVFLIILIIALIKKNK